MQEDGQGSHARRLTWSDIEDAAKDMFSFKYVDGMGVQWAKMAWAAMESHGLADYANEVEKCLVGIRVITLATQYREFCHLAWEEDPEPEHTEWAEMLDVHAFRVAQLVGADFEPDEEDVESLFPLAIETLVDEARNDIYRTLKKAFQGDSMLYVSLWLTRWQEPEDDDSYYDDEDDDEHDVDQDYAPAERDACRERSLLELLADDQVLDAVLNDPDVLTLDAPDKMRSFDWVTEGMPSIH